MITSAKTLFPNKVTFTDRGVEFEHNFLRDAVHPITDTEKEVLNTCYVFRPGGCKLSGHIQGESTDEGNGKREREAEQMYRGKQRK